MKICRYFIVVLVVFLTSCEVTRSLWIKKYDEIFRQFLVSRDGKHIVFIASNHHYVFEDHSGLMIELLNSKSRDMLFINIKKTYLKLGSKNHVTGKVTVEVFDNNMLQHQEFHMFEALGFRNNKEGNLATTFDIDGVRYNADGWVGNELGRLDRNYTITVYQPNSFFGGIAKAAITPITIGADAVLLIGKTILIPLRSN